MNSAIYRQADSRWGSLPYPTKSYSFAGNGCGCCACTHNIIEIPKYAKYTPANVRPYMVGQGFATKGNGTTWAGIKLTLQHYGFSVSDPNIGSSMASAWELLNKKGAPKQGVLLFRRGTRGGVTWTSGGHYVAFLNYKVVNGKHYFYTKDSGGRHNDGWFCYETKMMGLLPKIWIITKVPDLPAPKPTPTPAPSKGKYTGTIARPTIKKGSKGDNVKNLQKFLNWYGGYKLAVDGKCGPKTVAAIRAFQNKQKLVVDGIYGPKTYDKALTFKKKIDVTKTYQGTLPTTKIVKSNSEVIADTIKWAKWIASDNRFHYGVGQHAHHNGCYFCGTQRLKKNHGIVDPEFTYCCNPFAGAAWAHGGCIPEALKKCQNTSSWTFDVGKGYDSSKLFDKLGHPAKSKLKAGDVLCRDTHVALYAGNGKIVEASGGDNNKKNSAKWNNSIRVRNLTDSNYKNFPRVYRYNGSVNTTMPIRHGEVSKRVAQWQAFLDWWFDGQVGSADGYYGDNTLKWTKKFQEERIGKGQGDGIIGPKTLAAAKECEKKQ